MSILALLPFAWLAVIVCIVGGFHALHEYERHVADVRCVRNLAATLTQPVWPMPVDWDELYDQERDTADFRAWERQMTERVR